MLSRSCNRVGTSTISIVHLGILWNQHSFYLLDFVLIFILRELNEIMDVGCSQRAIILHNLQETIPLSWQCVGKLSDNLFRSYHYPKITHFTQQMVISTCKISQRLPFHTHEAVEFLFEQIMSQFA
ncbi:hypothetical protein HanIR_Chr10g0461681 [Helianthus annuus]|nr:hypothetical protein HanIR_Chr10g0461681 [Helianthus annuus]